MRTALVFAAAPLQPTARLRARLAEVEAPYVVAADEGAATALAFGYQPDVVIGDLDSLSDATRLELEFRGVTFETYPRDKDFTDGQLALERALQIQPTAMWLLGFLGGPRLDQSVANILLLRHINVQTVLMDGMNECVLLGPHTEFGWNPAQKEIVSLIPLEGDVEGVTTRGLRWSLKDEVLLFGDTRGLSNEPISDDVSVSIGSGHVLLTRHFPITEP